MTIRNLQESTKIGKFGNDPDCIKHFPVSFTSIGLGDSFVNHCMITSGVSDGSERFFGEIVNSRGSGSKYTLVNSPFARKQGIVGSPRTGSRSARFTKSRVN